MNDINRDYSNDYRVGEPSTDRISELKRTPLDTKFKYYIDQKPLPEMKMYMVSIDIPRYRLDNNRAIDFHEDYIIENEL